MSSPHEGNFERNQPDTPDGKPDGKHGSPRGTIDPEYDYLDSIKTAANSGRLVQVRAKIFCGAESVATHPARNIVQC